MSVYTMTVTIESEGSDDIADVTASLRKAVADSGFSDGTATVFVPGSTGAVTTIEYEPGVVNDLRSALERAVPKEIDYAHDRAWGDGNGYSHVRAAWIGPSLTVPFTAGELLLGTWQQVVIVDCDNRPRSRRVVFQIMGE